MNETGMSPEMPEEKEPTSQELAKACEGVLSEEDCLELASMEIGEAVGYAFTLLMTNGIEDPEGFLKEKGILVEAGEEQE